MLQQFGVTSAEPAGRDGHRVRSRITTFIAETDLRSAPQVGIVQTITGRIVPDATPEEISKLNKPDVEVIFESRIYRFSRLDNAGAFELSIVHKPEERRGS